MQDKRIVFLENRLDTAKRIINELLGALDCPDPELRALTRDVAISYMVAFNQDQKIQS